MSGGHEENQKADDDDGHGPYISGLPPYGQIPSSLVPG